VFFVFVPSGMGFQPVTLLVAFVCCRESTSHRSSDGPEAHPTEGVRQFAMNRTSWPVAPPITKIVDASLHGTSTSLPADSS
jgi:hypothetical protein